MRLATPYSQPAEPAPATLHSLILPMPAVPWSDSADYRFTDATVLQNSPDRQIHSLPAASAEPNRLLYTESVPLHVNDAKHVYEKIYCARGEMENRIKEQQLDLFADRTSAATMAANQLRLWMSSVAYVLINELRRVGLEGT